MELAQYKTDMIKLGIMTNLAGYRCLVQAIPLYRENPGQSLTKQLYPEVGEKCSPNLTGAQVEKQIRYAIEIAWQNRDPETWRRYFPMDRKPTNGEFISRISENWN